MHTRLDFTVTLDVEICQGGDIRKRKPPLARASDQWGQRKGGKERQSKRGYASYTFIYHFTPLSGQRQSDKGMVFLLIFWMEMPKKSLWEGQFQLSDRIGQHVKKSGAEAPQYLLNNLSASSQEQSWLWTVIFWWPGLLWLLWSNAHSASWRKRVACFATIVEIALRSASEIMMNWTAMPCGSGSFSGQELCERTTSAMALIGGFRRETLISSSKTSPDFSGCWQHMKAPPALISFVVPLMSVRWVSAKTGNVRLALGCCRLSVTLAVRKIIPPAYGLTVST